MQFSDYWDDLPAVGKTKFATRLSSSGEYLARIARGHKRPGPHLARAIEEATFGQVTAAELRPDIFAGLAG